jgi:hypothetical protein
VGRPAGAGVHQEPEIHNRGAELQLPKRIRKADPRLEVQLAELEQNPNCRRLQLQSILPVKHQRLVKYPLLLKEIKKHCVGGDDRDEWDLVT